MPRILDNLSPNATLLSTLRTTLELSHRADFCVGYFNLRGWKHVDEFVEPWTENGQQARILVGMQKLPHDELREALSMLDARAIDNQRALRLKQRLAEQFRDQLVIGAPTNNDEAALQRLVKQLKDGKVVVKLFLRHPLHAKLYLCFREDPVSPVVGYLGSSNLTFSGLSGQGELNVDVLDQGCVQQVEPVVRGPMERPLLRRHYSGVDRDYRGELGTAGTDTTVPCLSQDGVSPVPRSPRRSGRGSGFPGTSGIDCSSSKRPP